MKITTLIIVALFSLVLSGCNIIGIQYDQSNSRSTNEPGAIINKLDLSNKGLTALPDYVISLNNLEDLNLSHNQITGALPAEIKQLQNLKILDLSNNLMTGVPAEIGQLSNLQILNLSHNKFTGLPHELGNLKNLKTINLAGNSYSQSDLNIILKGLSPSIQVITE